MTTSTNPAPTFTGRTIAWEIEKATANVRENDGEIVVFSAGENMPITAAILYGEYDGVAIPEYAWDGEKWNEIGAI